MSPALQRTREPIPGQVGCIVPFGVKNVAGKPFDFDRWYNDVLAPCIESANMVPVRVDSIYGTQDLHALIWQMIETSELLIIDHTGKAPNVSYELGLATPLNKRFISITQDEADIPSDIRGRQRYLTYSTDFFEAETFKKELFNSVVALRDEPAQEMTLVPLSPAPEQVEAVVLTVDPDRVIVRAGEAVGTLRGSDVDWARAYKDLTTRFKVGQNVRGAFTYDPVRQALKFSMLSGQENPWLTISTKYPVGTKITGRVTGVSTSVGVFVKVHGTVTGLIPNRALIGAVVPNKGDEVTVTVADLNVAQRRVGLDLVGIAKVSANAMADATLPELGQRFIGTVVSVRPETGPRTGGYVLIKLPGFTSTGLLHVSKMQQDLRDDLAAGEIRVDDEIAVEVHQVDASRGRIQLADLGDVELDGPNTQDAA